MKHKYVISFALMEACLDVCIEASTPAEAKRKAIELVSSKEFCGEDNKYPPGMEDWNCNLYTYADYAGYPWSLPRAAFEHGKVLYFHDFYKYEYLD